MKTDHELRQDVEDELSWDPDMDMDAIDIAILIENALQRAAEVGAANIWVETNHGEVI